MKAIARVCIASLACAGWLVFDRSSGQEPTKQEAAIQKTVNQEPVVHFVNDVVPILTKHGCNSGGCHGRASGQNGFKLSLLGYEPLEDYEHLVHEARGRRIVPTAPQRSLLLLKATNDIPHQGRQAS